MLCETADSTLRLPNSAFQHRLLKLGWGFADQAASSTTNLLLMVAGARALGARSLGVITVGFAIYITLVVLQRGLVSQPLVASTSAATAGEKKREITGCALTITVVAGVASAALMVGAAMTTHGTARHALLLFAPWIPFTLVQDFWRSTLFRDDRGRAAAANDALWLVIMVPALMGAWLVKTDWAIVGAWGLGASAAAVAGFYQMRLLPRRFFRAFTVWHSELWPFGRWLLTSGITYTASSLVMTLLTVAFLGPAALGGLQAVRTVFAPITLIVPAVALPALPAMTRRLATSAHLSRRFALQVSGLLIALTSVYVALVGSGGSALLSDIFGASFANYDALVLPVAVEQVLLAGSGGFELLLTAGKRGRDLFVVQMARAFFGISLVALSASSGSLLAVAWSATAPAAVALTLRARFALRKGAG